MGADKHKGICNKKRKRRVRRLFMRVKRVGAQVCKARKTRIAGINDGQGTYPLRRVSRISMIGKACRGECAQGAQISRLSRNTRSLVTDYRDPSNFLWYMAYFTA